MKVSWKLHTLFQFNLKHKQGYFSIVPTLKEKGLWSLCYKAAGKFRTLEPEDLRSREPVLVTEDIIHNFFDILDGCLSHKTVDMESGVALPKQEICNTIYGLIVLLGPSQSGLFFRKFAEISTKYQEVSGKILSRNIMFSLI
jgi:hypothetical protein